MFRNLSPGTIGIKVNQREAVRLAKLGNFEGVDIFIDEVYELSEKFSPSYVKAIFESFNIKIGGWGLPFAWNDRNEKTYKEGLEKLKKYAEVAEKIGSGRVITWVPSWSDEKPYKENFAWHVERFKPVAEILKSFNCRFGLEFLGPKTLRENHKYEFIHTSEQMLELCEAIGTGNAGLLLDSWHWYTSGETLDDIKKLKTKDIVYVHISDAPEGIPVEKQIDGKRCLPGETGVIDLEGFLKTLREIDYDGPVTPEPFSEKINGLPHELAVRMAGGYFTNLWEKVIK